MRANKCLVVPNAVVRVILQVKDRKLKLIANELNIFNPRNFHTNIGIIWGDYCEEWKRQRNISLTILRSLGFGRKGIENKIFEETQHLINAIEVKYETHFRNTMAIYESKIKQTPKYDLQYCAQKAYKH